MRCSGGGPARQCSLRLCKNTESSALTPVTLKDVHASGRAEEGVSRDSTGLTVPRAPAPPLALPMLMALELNAHMGGASTLSWEVRVGLLSVAFTVRGLEAMKEQGKPMGQRNGALMLLLLLRVTALAKAVGERGEPRDALAPPGGAHAYTVRMPAALEAALPTRA